MSKTETKKEYWQRIANEKGVKFQNNDTIGMLVTAIAAKLKIDAEGFSPSGLQKKVLKALTDADAPKGKGWQKGNVEEVKGKGKGIVEKGKGKEGTKTPAAEKSYTPPAKQNRPGFPPVDEDQQKSNATISDSMKDYANNILNYIMKAPSIKQHGKFPVSEYNHMVNTADKAYTYETVEDQYGKYMTMTNSSGAVCRIPESGYLPL